MKPKIILFAMILLAALSCMAFSAQEEIERMDTSTFETPRRPGAVFAHDDHNEAAGLEDNCAICHHVYENGKLVEDESSEDSPCSECHGISAGPENGISLVNAFHKRCRDCHFDAGKGPVLCGQCHRKE